VFEQMSIKKDVFGKLDKIVKPGAILASNTSFLNLDEIASATSRPELVIGTHFFSPANVMRLLEVVRGEKTSKEVIATLMQLAKKIGKVPVLSRVCDGFIANRVMVRRSWQADALLLEGQTPQQVDKVMNDYGFAMGEFQMMDLAGLDVIGREETERTVMGDLVKAGRLGQKTNAGYYDYDEKRKGTPAAVVQDIIKAVAEHKGIKDAGPQSPDEILTRLLYVVINEGAKLLEEGIAIRASDIDMATIFGYNWPVYTGGPMFWADTVGLPNVVAKLQAYQKKYGDAFKPSALLVKMAAEGKTFTRN
jgi:3-hydroxyacyl-CoA dehydrogenase